MAISYAAARSGGRMPPHAPSRKMGAWKLAYADFLTALCAFFLVMWMINTPQVEREGVADYFSGKSRDVTYTSAAAAEGDQIAAILKNSSALQDYHSNVSVTQTNDFVRLDLFDTSAQPLFANGNAALNDTGLSLVKAAGDVIAPRGWQVSVEGHTDSNLINNTAYSNWDLSADRASFARRVLENSGVAPTKFQAVMGLSDTRPLIEGASHLPANRRISIVVHLTE